MVYIYIYIISEFISEHLVDILKIPPPPPQYSSYRKTLIYIYIYIYIYLFIYLFIHSFIYLFKEHSRFACSSLDETWELALYMVCQSTLITTPTSNNTFLVGMETTCQIQSLVQQIKGMWSLCDQKSDLWPSYKMSMWRLWVWYGCLI